MIWTFPAVGALVILMLFAMFSCYGRNRRRPLPRREKRFVGPEGAASPALSRSVSPRFRLLAAFPAIRLLFFFARGERGPVKSPPTAGAQTGVRELAGGEEQEGRCAALRPRKQSSPGPAGAARSAPSLAGGQIPFPAPAIWPATTPASRPLAATKPTTAFTKTGEPGGQSTGVVCQSEDLSKGRFETAPAAAASPRSTFCRESPRFDPSATIANSPDFRLWTLDFRLHFSPSTSCMS